MTARAEKSLAIASQRLNGGGGEKKIGAGRGGLPQTGEDVGDEVYNRGGDR